MSQPAIAPSLPEDPLRRTWPQSLPFYYGWVNVVVAAVAMTATLPGRTHGLGLITKPLLEDLQIDAVLFARINVVGTLAGAAFCLPIGWLIDRCGVRGVLFVVTVALGLSVVGMSAVAGPGSLLLGLVLVRGFGQSALSIVSMAAIGKWFGRRVGTAMGVFAVLLTFGFIGSVMGMGAAVKLFGWRAAWQDLGWIVLALAPLFWLLARSTPEACGLTPDAEPATDADLRNSEIPISQRQEPTGTVPNLRSSASKLGLSPSPSRFLSTATTQPAAHDFTLRQALATPAFWILVLGSSAFNLVWSGVTLFNESMLAERGLNHAFSVQIMGILTGVGLLANLVGGALATRKRVVKLLGVGLIFLAAGLVALPAIDGPTGARLYATAIGLSGGIVTVVFFAAWGHLFGRSHLGRIQGFAQLATVLASATGPVLMAESRALSGTYVPMFYGLAAVVGVLAIIALVTPVPRRREAEASGGRG